MMDNYKTNSTNRLPETASDTEFALSLDAKLDAWRNDNNNNEPLEAKASALDDALEKYNNNAKKGNAAKETEKE